MTEILDAEQLANRLQVDVRHIRRLTNDRAIPHLAIGPRMIRYDLDAVLGIKITRFVVEHIGQIAEAILWIRRGRHRSRLTLRALLLPSQQSRRL